MDVRPRVSGLIASVQFTEGAVVQRGDVLFEIDPRPFQAEVDRLRADLARAKAAFARADRRDASAPAGCRPRTPSPPRSTTAGSSSAAEAEAQVAAVEAALRAAELNLEFTHGDRADRRPRRPRHRHRGQPGVERARGGHAARDAGVARSDLRLVRGGRAVVPRVPARGRPARAEAQRRRAGPTSAWRWPARRNSRAQGRLQFLDNQLDAATGTIRVRARVRQRRRRADARPVRAAAHERRQAVSGGAGARTRPSAPTSTSASSTSSATTSRSPTGR